MIVAGWFSLILLGAVATAAGETITKGEFVDNGEGPIMKPAEPQPVG